MGLLDDAIREHLELKRRQGADPGEIALKEREALEPVLPDEPATWGAEPASGFEEWTDTAAEPVLAEPGSEAGAMPAGRALDLSTVGQETAEIDMREVLEDGGYAISDAHPSAQPAPVRARITEPQAQDLLELEIAGRANGESFDIPGQERLSFE